jgi:hypothetical protein
MKLDSPMGPDIYQQAWKAQSSRTRVTVASDLLLREVQRSQRFFQAVIFWRDFREIVVALLMIPDVVSHRAGTRVDRRIHAGFSLASPSQAELGERVAAPVRAELID